MPLRAVAELYGYQVGWDGATRTATVDRPDGARVAIVKPGAGAFIRNDRLLVPPAFLARLGLRAAVSGGTVDLGLAGAGLVILTRS